MGMRPKVAVIGAGNWGTTVAKMVATNLSTRPELSEFDPVLELFVHDEVVEGQNLSEAINKYHQNIKYLPGVILPDRVHANPDLSGAVKDATALVLATPHEFLPDQCRVIAGALTPKQRDTVMILNLAKGLHYDAVRGHLWRMSELAGEIIELPATRVGALSGPNVAKEIAKELFTEAVIASQGLDTRRRFRALFEKPYFAIRESTDVSGIEFGGALKNLVAIAAGFVDGFDLGNNAKATIIRLGMEEMYQFASLPEWPIQPQRQTFDGPAFLGDVITTCYGGRNRLLGETIGRAHKNGQRPMAVDEFEERILGGQIAQGYRTSLDVHGYLESVGRCEEFPLFKMVYDVLTQQVSPEPRFRQILVAR